MTTYTFKQFQAEYPDDEACLRRLMDLRYGGTEIVCPACGVETSFHPMTNRRAFACKDCGHHIYPCAGSIFHKSSTKLSIWFFAMYLMTSTRHGVAAKEIQRQTGVTYKTAWRICHELRRLMASADYHANKDQPLSGHVEIDETILGSPQTHDDRRRKGSNKQFIMGLVERDGRIIAGPIPDVTMHTVDPIVRENVKPGSTISTDELRSYNRLGDAYIHGRVNHKQEEYVRGVHHTNTLEGHWGHFKRAIRGTHVSVSPQHLWKYVAEFSYRRNYRHSHVAMFNLLMAAFSMPRLADA